MPLFANPFNSTHCSLLKLWAHTHCKKLSPGTGYHQICCLSPGINCGNTGVLCLCMKQVGWVDSSVHHLVDWVVSWSLICSLCLHISILKASYSHTQTIHLRTGSAWQNLSLYLGFHCNVTWKLYICNITRLYTHGSNFGSFIIRILHECCMFYTTHVNNCVMSVVEAYTNLEILTLLALPVV